MFILPVIASRSHANGQTIGYKAAAARWLYTELLKSRSPLQPFVSSVTDSQVKQIDKIKKPWPTISLCMIWGVGNPTRYCVKHIAWWVRHGRKKKKRTVKIGRFAMYKKCTALTYSALSAASVYPYPFITAGRISRGANAPPCFNTPRWRNAIQARVFSRGQSALL